MKQGREFSASKYLFWFRYEALDLLGNTTQKMVYILLKYITSFQ